MGEILQNIGEIHSIGATTREMIVAPSQCPALLQYRILLAGISQAGPDFSFVRLRPAKSQILATIHGKGKVWLPDTDEAEFCAAGSDLNSALPGAWRPCVPGQAYVTSANTPHGYHARARQSWSVCWVVYDTPVISPGRTIPFVVEADTRLLNTAVTGICQEAAGAADITLLEDWARLVHAYSMRIVQRPPDHRRLRALWETAGASLARPWTLADLASTAGMGPEQLRRVCLTETGRSPMQHLTSMRVTRATALLATGRSVKEVAPAVGYQNEFAFSSTYSRWTGRSPSSIRK